MAVRSEHLRYIRYSDGSEELYDLREDPNEWTNLAAKPEYLEAKKKLMAFATSKWADSAPTKSAFEFNPDTFVWREKSTGRQINGSKSVKK